MIKDVVSVIQEYKNNQQTSIPAKTYSTMFGGIKHWGDSAADRAIVAWNQNMSLLSPWTQLTGIDILDENIVSVIQFRNDITHRGFQGLPEDVALTTFALMVLVYVMALKRVGLDDKIIQDVMARRLVG
ncbi:hypothetical protein [Butyrivibrio sp. WCD2001]|uniref:hypothetical protein n=1 Tax=Butyrivibrio sp. WCD2001 TaxID=1280681 RepID=UPI000478C09C|nr:hypothetical protein [Butyrivibrio sp. WCD2001]